VTTIISHYVLSSECYMFVKDICSSVCQTNRQWISVDQGKVSESSVIHAGNVRDVWTYRQCTRCSTGD